MRKQLTKDRKGENDKKRPRREKGQRDGGKDRFNQKERCDAS